jgi:flotillin
VSVARKEDEKMGELMGFIIFGAVLLVIGIIVFIKSNLEICAPNEVMIFSGRQYRTKDGKVVGYRVIRGGRALRRPFVENVSRLSLNTMPIELDVRGALTKGQIPVNAKAMANIKIAGSEEQGLANAIERFLGKGTNVITGIAKDILEGTIRGVLATMLPDEANSNRIGLAKEVAKETREDLEKMGLILDTIKIQAVSDDKGYLEAIARKKNAEVQRDARIVEAESNAEASRKESEARKAAEIAEIESKKAVVEADRAFRVKQADWTSEANRAEERSKVAGEISRMEELKILEEKRVEANKLKYEAEVVVPSAAEKESLLNKAKGQAAYTFEDGKAKAEALELLRKQWEKPDSKDLFMIQLLPEIVEMVSKVIASNLQVEKLTVVDSGGNGTGGGIPHLVGSLAGSVNSFLEQIKTITGLDVARMIESKYSNKESKSL